MFNFLKSLFHKPPYYYELTWDRSYYKEERIFFTSKKDAEAYKEYWDHADTNDWFGGDTVTISEKEPLPIDNLIRNKIYLFHVFYYPSSNVQDEVQKSLEGKIKSDLENELRICVPHNTWWSFPFEKVGKVYTKGKEAIVYHYSPEQALESFTSYFTPD